MFRSNLKLIFSFIALCLISLSISWWNRSRKEGLDPDMFRLPVDVRINEVSMKKGEVTLLLTGGPGGWRVNKQYSADLDRVRLLFAAMDRARPRRLAGDSIASKVQREAMMVQFRENENQIQSVLIWGDPQSGSTWFMDPEKGIPAEMVIPGYRSSLTNLFSMMEEDWRDKRIFDFNWRNFVQLKMEFPSASADGYTISVRDGLLSIGEVAASDTTRLKEFMDVVQLLEAESFIRVSNNQKDSLLRNKPESVLTISEVSGRKHELRLFDKGLALRDSMDLFKVGSGETRALKLPRKAFQLR